MARPLQRANRQRVAVRQWRLTAAAAAAVPVAAADRLAVRDHLSGVNELPRRKQRGIPKSPRWCYAACGGEYVPKGFNKTQAKCLGLVVYGIRVDRKYGRESGASDPGKSVNSL